MPNRFKLYSVSESAECPAQFGINLLISLYNFLKQETQPIYQINSLSLLSFTDLS